MNSSLNMSYATNIMRAFSVAAIVHFGERVGNRRSPHDRCLRMAREKCLIKLTSRSPATPSDCRRRGRRTKSSRRRDFALCKCSQSRWPRAARILCTFCRDTRRTPARWRRAACRRPREAAVARSRARRHSRGAHSLLHFVRNAAIRPQFVRCKNRKRVSSFSVAILVGDFQVCHFVVKMRENANRRFAFKINVEYWRRPLLAIFRLSNSQTEFQLEREFRDELAMAPRRL